MQRRDGGELERRGSCITQWRSEESSRGVRWRRAADEGGDEAASCSGKRRRRAVEELDGGNESCR